MPTASAVQAQSSGAIIVEIDAHMKKSGILNKDWYVGITSDINERLFGFHQVPRENHWFIYRRALNSSEARSIEAAYHRAGCTGGGSGGDHTAVYIYAYVITPTTVE
jgi:hypothetical protein